MRTATITLENGVQHTCRFLSAIESPWMQATDPPLARVPHPRWPEHLIYQEIPGVQHRPIVRQIFLGTPYSDAEWTAYWRRGLI